MFLFWRRWKEAQAAKANRSAPKQPYRYVPRVEILEKRLLMAWQPLGPLTQTGWPASNSIFADAVAGRTTSLAYDVNFDGKGDNQIVQGTAGGGVWLWNETLNPQAWRSADGSIKGR